MGDEERTKELLASNPLLARINRVDFLPKGFSKEAKYVLWEGETPRYLLRLGSSKDAASRHEEFQMLKLHHEQGVRCPRPYLWGCTTDGQACFSVLGYIAGDCAQEILSTLPAYQQFEVGVQAGLELHKLHQMRGRESHSAWLGRRVAKYRKRVRQALDLGLTFHRQAEVETYIESHLDLLLDAPVCFQHDDYHPGNLIISGGQFAGVIDFNRTDFGDPIEDFYKVPWFTVPLSILFACGQIQGYLSTAKPKNFWPRYNLFLAMNLHGSLVWAHEALSAGQQISWKKQIADMLGEHDLAGNGPPRWYRTSFEGPEQESRERPLL